MRGTTHLATGLVCAALIPDPSLISVAGIAIGSILPDIDKKKSLVGRHIPVLPYLLAHRGITHSLLATVPFWFLCRPIAVGMLIHLALDMLNPDGIKLFWPIPYSFRLGGFFQSGGIVDNLLSAVLWAATLYMYLGIAMGTWASPIQPITLPQLPSWPF